MLAIDFGGTNVRVGLVSSQGGALSNVARALVPASRAASDLLALIFNMCDEVLRSSCQSAGAAAVVTAIAVSQPGAVDDEGSVSKLAAFREWGDEKLMIGAALRERYQLPVHVFEDASCAVAAEVEFGAGRLADTVVALTVGTGVGSAVALNGGATYHRGARGLVELGHHIVDPSDDARLCPCGQRGCLEAYASGRAIATQAGESCAEAVFDRSDPLAVRTLAEAAKYLALACITATRAYDPDVIVVCGSLGARLTATVRTQVRERTWKLYDDAALVPISNATCVEPGLQGAAALALKLSRPPSSRRPRLRHATPADAEALYNVCLKTGDSGNDYVFHSSAFAFALEDDAGDVSGYVLGVADTVAFEAETQRAWWPVVRARYPLDDTFLDRFRPNERDLIRGEIHKVDSPTADGFDRAALLREFPSHMHIDLMQHVQGRGLGVAMVARLLDALRGAGSHGVHLTQSSENHRAFHFYTTKLGFKLYHKFERDWVLVRAL